MMFSAFQTFGKLGALASSVARAWSPAALWPAGAASPGLWIDPSYSASEWKDSAGTTALSTVGTVLDSSNPVGLILDRKGGLSVSGSDTVTNGNFATDTAWTKGTGVTITGGAAVFTNVAGNQDSLYQSCMTDWKYYELTYTVLDFSAGSIRMNNGGYNGPPRSANGTYTERVRTASKNIVFKAGAAGTTLKLTNISVREIPGLHLSQSTSAARPVASGRKNLLVGTDALATQSVTVTAIPHTITFSGGGTVTASGAYTGALTSGQTFTPTAGTLTLTVSGSVTSAQLERGSAATTYQAVVSDSSYTATGFPQYLKFDGVDDALASATFAAGTIPGLTDCLIAVRRDSTDNAVCGIYNAPADGVNYVAIAASGSGAGSIGPSYSSAFVDGVQLTGGNLVTRDTMHVALSVGSWHILEVRGIDLSAWTAVYFGLRTGYVLNGALGEIQLFANGQDANRDKARARMAAYFGVTLP